MTFRGAVSLVVVLAATALQVGMAAAHRPVTTLKLGDVRTFNSTKLRPGDTVVCVGNGKRVSARVLPYGARPSGVFMHTRAAGALAPRLDTHQPVHLLISTIAPDTFLVRCI
jgi:hypothetical protein